MPRRRLPYVAYLALVWTAVAPAAAQTELKVKALDPGGRVLEGIRFAFAGVESLPTTGAGVTGLTVPEFLLKATNRLGEAEPLMRRALAIHEASFGPGHPDVAGGLNNLATLLQDANRLGEAEPLIRRALAITEASYGPDHPRFAIVLNNLATLLKATNRRGEAESLMRRALAIFEASFGEDHPNVRGTRGNLKVLLWENAKQSAPPD